MSVHVNRSIWRLETTRNGAVVFGAGAAGSIICYDVQRSKQILEHPVSSGWINGLAYSEDTDCLTVATSRGELRTLDPLSLQPRQSLSTNYWLNGIKRVTVAGNEQFFVTTAEGEVFLWGPKSNRFLRFTERHSDQVWDCAVSNNGEFAATVGGNGQ